MLEQLETIYQQARAALDGVNSSDGLAEWNRQYLGKKGEFAERKYFSEKKARLDA